MSFSSGPFLIFILAFLGIFFAVKGRVRTWVLLLASYFFYGIHEPVFCVLIAISTLNDFVCSRQIEKSDTKVKRRGWLIASLVVNLGLLGWFKYANFFHELLFNTSNLAAYEGYSISKYIIPIGISFYTFQTISYNVDVYRGRIKAERNLLDFFVFISFFPQLIAGPIERYNKLMPQLKKVGQLTFSKVNLKVASSLILWGLFKKIVVADRMGVLVDKIFEHPSYYDSIGLWAGGFLFLIQIYADFSGYTLMARGLAKLIGVDLTLNWNFPLFRSSTRSFWAHWNITLTSWFRDYVYIPLGGNQRAKFLIALNVIVVFVLSGLWHGANITFALWGLLNALLIIVEVLWVKRLKSGFSKWLGVGVVVLFQSLFFTVFRSTSFNEMINYFSEMFWSFNIDLRVNVVSLDMWWGSHMINLLVLFIFFSIEFMLFRKTKLPVINAPVLGWRLVLVLTVIILFVGEFGNQPFIYFQF